MLTAVMHADAGVEQLEHVLIALLVPAARRVGVRELVDDAQLRLARAGSRRHPSPRARRRGSRCLRRGMTSRSAELRLGVGAAVGLDEPDDDVDALAAEGVRVLEHRVGLADARRGADVDAQPRALRRSAVFASICSPVGRARGPTRLHPSAARDGDVPAALRTLYGLCDGGSLMRLAPVRSIVARIFGGGRARCSYSSLVTLALLRRQRRLRRRLRSADEVRPAHDTRLDHRRPARQRRACWCTWSLAMLKPEKF